MRKIILSIIAFLTIINLNGCAGAGADEYKEKYEACLTACAELYISNPHADYRNCKEGCIERNL